MTAWWEDAQCRGADEDDVDAFTGQRTAAEVRRVRATCDGCPVTTACLEAALEEEEGVDASGRFGIRGGLTPLERQRLAKRQAAARLTARGQWEHGTVVGYSSHKCRCDQCKAANSAYKRERYAFTGERRNEARRARRAAAREAANT